MNRTLGIILLLSIAVSIMLPPSFSVSLENDSPTVIGALDVCRHATPMIASTGEMPCLASCFTGPVPENSVMTASLQNRPFTLTQFTPVTEQPPKA